MSDPRTFLSITALSCALVLGGGGAVSQAGAGTTSGAAAPTATASTGRPAAAAGEQSARNKKAKNKKAKHTKATDKKAKNKKGTATGKKSKHKRATTKGAKGKKATGKKARTGRPGRTRSARAAGSGLPGPAAASHRDSAAPLPGGGSGSTAVDSPPVGGAIGGSANSGSGGASARGGQSTPDLGGTGTCPAGSVSRLHGTNKPFYIEMDKFDHPAGYAGWRLDDTLAGAGTWIRLGGFTGDSLRLAEHSPAEFPARGRSAGGTGPDWLAYAYLTSAGESTAAQPYTVEVWDGMPSLPGATKVCEFVDGFTGVSDIGWNNSNKITSISLSDSSPTVGSDLTITATGDTGTIGAGPEDPERTMVLQAAQTAGWPADALMLTGVTLRLGSATYSDSLRINPAGQGEYTATYSFAVRAPLSGPLAIKPSQQIANGVNMAVTGRFPATDVTVSETPQTAEVDMANSAEVVGDRLRITNTVTTSNSGGSPVTVDAVVDTSTAGEGVEWTFRSGSAKANGQSLPDPARHNGQLVFQGPFTVPANSAVAISYSFDSNGRMKNEAVAKIGGMALGREPGSEEPDTVQMNPLVAVDALIDTVEGDPYVDAPVEVQPLDSQTPIAKGRANGKGRAATRDDGEPLTIPPGQYRIVVRATCRPIGVFNSEVVTVTDLNSSVDVPAPATWPCAPPDPKFDDSSKVLSWGAPHNGGRTLETYTVMYVKESDLQADPKVRWGRFAVGLTGQSIDVDQYRAEGCPAGARCDRNRGPLERGEQYRFRVSAVNGISHGFVSFLPGPVTL